MSADTFPAKLKVTSQFLHLHSLEGGACEKHQLSCRTFREQELSLEHCQQLCPTRSLISSSVGSRAPLLPASKGGSRWGCV